MVYELFNLRGKRKNICNTLAYCYHVVRIAVENVSY